MASKRKPGSTPTKDEAMRLMDMPSGDWSPDDMEDFISGRREIIEDDGGWVYALSHDGTIEILVEGAGGKGNAKGAKINKGKAYDAIMQKFKGVTPRAASLAEAHPEPDLRTSPSDYDEAFGTSDAGPDLRTSPSGYKAPADLRTSPVDYPEPDLRTSPSGPHLGTSPSGYKPPADLRTSPVDYPEPDLRTSRDEDLRTSPAGADAPSKPVNVDLDKMNPLGDYAQKLMKSAAALSDRLSANAYDKSTEYSDTPVSDHADALSKAVGQLSEWLSATDLAPGLFGDVRHDGSPAATKAAELNAEANPRDSSKDAEKDAASEELDYIEDLNFGVSKNPNGQMQGETLQMPPMYVTAKK